jgi:hypothetical protein
LYLQQYCKYFAKKRRTSDKIILQILHFNFAIPDYCFIFAFQRNGNMENKVLQNGLSEQQVQKAKEVLTSVSIRKIAKKIGTSDSNIRNVLRGTSPNVELLDRAIREANKIISKREKLIQNLPV